MKSLVKEIVNSVGITTHPDIVDSKVDGTFYSENDFASLCKQKYFRYGWCIKSWVNDDGKGCALVSKFDTDGGGLLIQADSESKAVIEATLKIRLWIKDTYDKRN